MSFPRYGSYRDSGVEWVGEVPSHWAVAPIKAHFQVVGGSTPKSDVQEFWDGEIPWVTPVDLDDNHITDVINSRRSITPEGLASCGTTLVPPGSLVLSTRAPIGSLGVTGVAACTNQGCKSLVPKGTMKARLLAYCLSIATAELRIRGKGTTFLELSSDELGSFRVAFPPLSEQTAIAAFLDRETGKIDALIAEQKRLIELLKEKRQAVISHAVTKGLDPDAPMKDSGIEWLGMVPAHWEVRPFKTLAAIRYGIGEPPPYRDVGTPLIRATNVDAGKVISTGLVYVDPLDIPTHRIIWLSPGDIIVVRSGAHTGDSAIIRDEHCPAIAGFDIVITPHCYQADLLQYVLLSSYMLEGQISLEKLRAAQPHLNAQELGATFVLVPPQDEQDAMVAFLDRETAKIDALTEQAKSAITLLQERRAALISAAVTGKIDVRGLVSDQAEAA